MRLKAVVMWDALQKPQRSAIAASGTSERRSYYPQYMQQVYDTDLNKLLICTDPAKRVWRDAQGTVVDSK